MPAWAAALDELGDELLATRTCLVHGDVTPKNILVAPGPDAEGPFWVLDAEVAQLGPPVLDLGPCPRPSGCSRPCGGPGSGPRSPGGPAFLDAYASSTPTGSARVGLARHVGGVLAGRVAGKSRVDYLDVAQVDATRSIVVRLLAGAELDEVWPTTKKGLPAGI